MLEDGKNVILTNELKTRLYMSQDDAFEAENLVNMAQHHKDDEDSIKDIGQAILERRKQDPTYGLTADQKAKLERKKTAKPRPRDLFPAQEMIKNKERRIIARKLRRQEEQDE